MSNISWLPNVDNLINYLDRNDNFEYNKFVENSYNILLNDFFNQTTPVSFEGHRVLLESNKNLDCGKLKVQDCRNGSFYDCSSCPFKNKFDIFNHICTNEYKKHPLKLKPGYKKNNRTPGEFSIARTLLVTWIKPLIMNSNDIANVDVKLSLEGGSKIWTIKLKTRNYSIVLTLPKNSQVIYLKTAYYTGNLKNCDYINNAIQTRRNATDGVSTTL